MIGKGYNGMEAMKRIRALSSCLTFILLGTAMALAQEQAVRDGFAALRVVFFHSPSCHECQEVKRFLPQITNLWGDSIVVKLHNVEDIKVFGELLKYEKHYGVTVAAPPAIFVGDRALVGEEEIVKGINDAIENALANGMATFKPDSAPADTPAVAEKPMVPAEVASRFKSFGPGAVAVAGLIDGINPCTFTTIVFFLSMLANLKRSRREMLVVGAVSRRACLQPTSYWGSDCWARSKPSR